MYVGKWMGGGACCCGRNADTCIIKFVGGGWRTRKGGERWLNVNICVHDQG